jgi:hypothetical protein
MGITTGVTTEAKLVFLSAVLNDNCKLALYTSQANIGPDTKAYTPEGEVRGQGYKPGGISLKGCRVWEDRGAACLTWESPTFPNASVTAAGYMIYDASKNNKALFVAAYGAEYTSSNGPFVANLAADTIVFS